MCVKTRQLVTHCAGITAKEYFKWAISFADAVEVILQVSQTLQRMVQRGFAHNDIKSINICVFDEENGPAATVIDLGLASRLGTWNIYSKTSKWKKFPWIAPELLQDTHPCSEASDVYGLAHLIEGLLGLQEGRSLHSSLNNLVGWVRAARSHNPVERPGLSALIEVLQVLRELANMAPSTSLSDMTSSLMTSTEGNTGFTTYCSISDASYTTCSDNTSSLMTSTDGSSSKTDEN